jgi:hypothetical protein
MFGRRSELTLGARRSSMVLIQILLPTGATGATPHHATAFGKTREELADKFDGLTAYLRSPAEGVWRSPEGEHELDHVVMVEVVTTTFDVVWWRKYATTLAERFAQDDIHVRAVPIYTLNEGDV